MEQIPLELETFSSKVGFLDKELTGFLPKLKNISLAI
jgi:hypothetical protein